MPTPTPAVCLFGNGLSIDYSDAYRIAALTAQVRDSIDTFAASPGIAAELVEFAQQVTAGLTGADPEADFERLVGPLDQLADALGPLEKVAIAFNGVPAGNVFQQARDAARSLYLRTLGIILGIIADTIGQGGAAIDRIRQTASWSLQSLHCHSTLRVFTLNYDGLLASRLVELAQESDPLKFHLSDMFYGWSTDLVIKDDPPLEITAHPYRLNEKEFQRGGPEVALYHLHGSLAWLENPTTSDLYKAHHLDDLRNQNIYSRWANGEDMTVQPVVVLGSNKQKAVLRAPFSWAYRELRNSVSEARRVLVGGYSFRDVAVNDALRSALKIAVKNNLDPRWLVISRAATPDAETELRNRTIAVLSLNDFGAKADAYVEYRFDGLSQSLADVAPEWWCPPVTDP